MHSVEDSVEDGREDGRGRVEREDDRQGEVELHPRIGQALDDHVAVPDALPLEVVAGGEGEGGASEPGDEVADDCDWDPSGQGWGDGMELMLIEEDKAGGE